VAQPLVAGVAANKGRKRWTLSSLPLSRKERASQSRVGRALAPGDEQEHSVRLPLLREGAVSVHRFERPLAAEMDDEEQAAGRPGPARRDGSDAWNVMKEGAPKAGLPAD
jgi:hypothetical protein